ncbi:hypothetical protein HNV12_09940 [Methanococcoides sp. SA1]|nr:hypothetical protein [Methanococcoides sp. SA1]
MAEVGPGAYCRFFFVVCPAFFLLIQKQKLTNCGMNNMERVGETYCRNAGWNGTGHLNVYYKSGNLHLFHLKLIADTCNNVSR